MWQINRKCSAAFSSIGHRSIFLLHSCRSDNNGAPPWLDLEEEERQECSHTGEKSSPGSSRSSSAQARTSMHSGRTNGRAPPAQSSRFWELPEGNLRALHVCKGIWNKVIYGNTETWQPSREWWNAQLQIKVEAWSGAITKLSHSILQVNLHCDGQVELLRFYLYSHLDSMKTSKQVPSEHHFLQLFVSNTTKLSEQVQLTWEIDNILHSFKNETYQESLCLLSEEL